MSPLWRWYHDVAGAPWELYKWDCFAALLDSHPAAGFSVSYAPDYSAVRALPRESRGAQAQRIFARHFRRGLQQYRKIETPVPGAAVLFCEGRVPIHVGIWMAPQLMAHTNVTTATTLADFGPGTDYQFNFEGFYVPK